MQYAEVIAKVLQVEVDIVDASLYRIAGTGRFAQSIGSSMEKEGMGFKWVLKNKKTLIIEEPRNHPICKECPGHEVCLEVFEIGCPIMLKEEVIGMIALACFDQEQKKHVFENLPEHIAFLEKIAELIASKYGAHIYYKETLATSTMLQKVMEFVRQGVIIFDTKRRIQYLNKYAENILGSNKKQLDYLAKINELRCMPIQKKGSFYEQELLFKVGEKKIYLQGQLFVMNKEAESFSEVFIFEDIIDIKKRYLKPQHQECTFDSVIGKDKAILSLKAKAKRLAQIDRHILIYGESGTGKETLARAIHHESLHKEEPFLTVNCKESIDPLFGQEVFGSGSLSKVNLVREGVLFFDEIADLSLRMQAKLMYLLEDDADFKGRIIASTSRELGELVASNRFREDLYYLLYPFSLTIPAVRERKQDIRWLIDHFFDKYTYIEGKKIKIEEEAYYELEHYPWYGNMREMENIISYIVLINKNGVVRKKDLTRILKQENIVEDMGFDLKELEKKMIIKAMNYYAHTTEGKRAAAKALGISPATLYRKLEQYHIGEERIYKISQNEK